MKQRRVGVKWVFLWTPSRVRNLSIKIRIALYLKVNLESNYSEVMVVNAERKPHWFWGGVWGQNICFLGQFNSIVSSGLPSSLLWHFQTFGLKIWCQWISWHMSQTPVQITGNLTPREMKLVIWFCIRAIWHNRIVIFKIFPTEEKCTAQNFSGLFGLEFSSKITKEKK